MKFLCMTSATIFSCSAFADDESGSSDVIQDFLNNSLKGLFGSGSGFWKVFILADIALATMASLKSKNPTVFVGVFVTAMLPGYLIKRYVFPA